MQATESNAVMFKRSLPFTESMSMTQSGQEGRKHRKRGGGSAGCSGKSKTGSSQRNDLILSIVHNKMCFMEYKFTDSNLQF